MKQKRNRFEKSSITGLSEDIIDFIFEENANNSNLEDFKGSFYHICSEMIIKGCDLSGKQMDIIERDYEKVKSKRMMDQGYLKSISFIKCILCNRDPEPGKWYKHGNKSMICIYCRKLSILVLDLKLEDRLNDYIEFKKKMKRMKRMNNNEILKPEICFCCHSQIYHLTNYGKCNKCDCKKFKLPIDIMEEENEKWLISNGFCVGCEHPLKECICEKIEKAMKEREIEEGLGEQYYGKY